MFIPCCRFCKWSSTEVMDPGYRERQGYYGRDQDPQQDIRHHQQQQHQLQQQQPQLLPHYAHQLPHHQSLLQPHLPPQHQLHHTQPAFVLDQGDQVRGREDFAGRLTGSAVLQQMLPSSGQVLASSMHRSHPHFTEHSHTQLAHLTSQASYVPPTTSTQSIVDAPASGSQAFMSPQSPTQQDSSDEHDVEEVVEEPVGSMVINENVRVVTVSEPQNARVVTLPEPQCEPVLTSASSADMDTPKKRAVRLALAETQQNVLTAPQNLLRRDLQVVDQDIWKPDIPIGLSLQFSLDGKISGLRSERSLEKGARFGPFNGKLVDEAVGFQKDSSWELCMRGKVFFYVDGQNKSHNNWMAFVESANSEEEQNLEAFQSYGDIYFRTTKVVEPGSELKVFYSDEYANHVGFKKKLSDLQLKSDSQVFPCGSCDQSYPSAKRLLRHLKISHDPDRANDLRPVLTWQPRTNSENAENEKPVIAKPVKSSSPTSKKTQVLTTNSSSMVEERFICTTCGKNFLTRGRLAAHETFHDYSEEHICNICGESFTNSNTLAKHMVTHKAKPYKCQSCGNAFTTRNMLSRHERLSHTFNHKCRVCGMQFVKKRECNRHEKIHPDWRNFRSVQIKPEKRSRLKKVVQSDEDDDVEEGEFDFLNTNEAKEVVEAQEEEEEEENNANLPKDMLGKRVNYYDRPRPYKCQFCPKRYLSKKAKLDHEAERHTKKCRFKCTHCPSVFATEIRYVEHVKRHIENRPFHCALCPMTFASESALKNHQGEHTGLKPVKCDICGKGFRTRHFMTAHKRRMHKVQQMRFACSYCNKPFSDKGNLIKHERRHKGIRPYVCLICGQGFTSNYCLISHNYTHTKERPFQCPHCDQKFTLNQHLTNHMYKEHTSHGKPQKTQAPATQNAATIPATQIVNVPMQPQMQL
nr:histone-lysine N-methyltransferase PRDM9-like [Lytechinus pictus]